MKYLAPFVFLILNWGLTSAQEIDSIITEGKWDSRTIESEPVAQKKDLDSLIGAAVDTLGVIDSLTRIVEEEVEKPRMIYIERSMLDSLLSPYYEISVDDLDNDSLTHNITFTPKYRMKIDPDTKDTSYVTLPKSTYFINVMKTYGIDTIEIPAAIELASIDRKKMAKDPVWWRNKNSLGLDLNEVAFVNWNAGGQNSVSGLVKVYFARDYEKLYTIWKNEVSARYGLNNREDDGLIKTDDEVRLSSSFEYRKDTLSDWYYTAQFSFRTQFTDGYKNPGDEDPISRFFAPAYMFLGLGSTYNLKEELFSVYLSPFTFKSTYVLDEKLSEEGAYGVTPGEQARHELGFLVRSQWDVEIVKNVAMTNALELYTDYINNFGNIDVDWVLSFRFKINKLLEANLRTHLIYDDDIKTKEDTNGDGNLETLGARVQFKQQLGIGILYSF